MVPLWCHTLNTAESPLEFLQSIPTSDVVEISLPHLYILLALVRPCDNGFWCWRWRTNSMTTING